MLGRLGREEEGRRREDEERRREEGRRRREESEEVRSRSATPGPSMGRVLMERHRKTPIPILCSRGAWMVHCVQPGL